MAGQGGPGSAGRPVRCRGTGSRAGTADWSGRSRATRAARSASRASVCPFPAGQHGDRHGVPHSGGRGEPGGRPAASGAGRSTRRSAPALNAAWSAGRPDPAAVLGQRQRPGRHRQHDEQGAARLAERAPADVPAAHRGHQPGAPGGQPVGAPGHHGQQAQGDRGPAGQGQHGRQGQDDVDPAGATGRRRGPQLPAGQHGQADQGEVGPGPGHGRQGGLPATPPGGDARPRGAQHRPDQDPGRPHGDQRQQPPGRGG